MFNKRNLLAFVGILVLFAIGLVGFYIFSAPYGDGLEKTMEEGEVEEAEPVYTAPLDYGENYLATLSLGIIGFAVVMLFVYLITWLLRKSNAPQQR